MRAGAQLEVAGAVVRAGVGINEIDYRPREVYSQLDHQAAHSELGVWCAF